MNSWNFFLLPQDCVAPGCSSWGNLKSKNLWHPWNPGSTDPSTDPCNRSASYSRPNPPRAMSRSRPSCSTHTPYYMPNCYQAHLILYAPPAGGRAEVKAFKLHSHLLHYAPPDACFKVPTCRGPCRGQGFPAALPSPTLCPTCCLLPRPHLPGAMPWSRHAALLPPTLRIPAANVPAQGPLCKDLLHAYLPPEAPPAGGHAVVKAVLLYILLVRTLPLLPYTWPQRSGLLPLFSAWLPVQSVRSSGTPTPTLRPRKPAACNQRPTHRR